MSLIYHPYGEGTINCSNCVNRLGMTCPILNHPIELSGICKHWSDISQERNDSSELNPLVDTGINEEQKNCEHWYKKACEWFKSKKNGKEAYESLFELYEVLKDDKSFQETLGKRLISSHLQGIEDSIDETGLPYR